MADFPTMFSEQHVNVWDVDISSRGRESLASLEEDFGLELVSGLLESDLRGILEIAATEDVREFCPNDLERFSAAESWLSKGRGAFLLRVADTKEIVGYSWAGIQRCDELPDHPTTTAFRTQVRGTGKDLVIATVEGARAIHGASDFGLETWVSNTAAVITYVRSVAELIRPKSEEKNKATGEIEPVQRPTLRPRKHDFLVDGVYHRYDTRLFMGFPEPEFIKV